LTLAVCAAPAEAAPLSFGDFVTSAAINAVEGQNQTIGFAYAGNKFVGSVYFGSNNNQLYSTNLTGGGVDYSFECIGLKLAAEQCFDCIKHGGTATVVGMIPVGQKIELDGPIFLREKKIQGCSMGSNRFKVDMPRYIELYRQGRLMLDEMITRRGRLEDVNEAFRAMKAGEVSRTVLMLD
jgi:Zn-dependent alcohol dehydrogenase